MGYRDDFYIVANIVGHTGDLRAFPTVYFHWRGEYGHITQKHDVTENEGREIVGNADNYTMKNEWSGGKYRLVEREGDYILHTSRNRLAGRREITMLSLPILAQSVYNFSELKRFATMTVPEKRAAIARVYGEDAAAEMFGP